VWCAVLVAAGIAGAGAGAGLGHAGYDAPAASAADEWATAMVDCITAAGFPATTTSGGGISLGYPGSDDTRMNLAVQSCSTEHPEPGS
jgi:hypothetical protein